MEEIIAKIKFLSKIQKGDKINVKHLTIQQDCLITKFTRSFIYNDTRSNAYSFIYLTIKKGFETLEMLQKDKVYDKAIFTNLIEDMKETIKGLINIKETYIEDLMFSCKIDSLIQEIEARLKEIER